MNRIKKTYCRVFQTALRIALPFLPYRKPEIIGSVREIPDVLEENGVQSVLIVTDSSIMRLGLLDSLEVSLHDNGIDYAIYDKTVANPTTDNVAEALGMYRRRRCNAIIGFGGGSSMDCAKAVGARVARPRKKLSRMEGILKVGKKLPLLIAVPTTAGTGSETTLAAVITDSKTRHKYAINDFPLIPRYAVLDPRITLSLPPHVTATTGMDALTHAVEAYIGRSTTRETRKDALLAVKHIFRNLDKAYFDGGNLEARRKMLNAAYFAGCAFTKSYVGYVHAVAHSLGGEYNVAHGLANAVILPVVLEKYTSKCGGTLDRKLRKLAIAAGIADRNVPADEAAKLFIEEIKEMKKRYGIGDKIPELKEKDIKKLSSYADKEANPLYPVPVLMNARELSEIYKELLI